MAAPRFPPIAIVGQACLLPGAASPAELWSAVAGRQDLLSDVPEGRWRIAPEHVHAASPDDSRDRTWSDRGGYVRGFERHFEPAGFLLPPESILGLDPLFKWVLHTARAALRSAGYDPPMQGLPAAGLILGNLSFPSASLARFAEAVWMGPQAAEMLGVRASGAFEAPDPRNRFMSGLPAQLAARALGLSAGGFALDAACASSFYALKLACDRLHSGQADLMLAGAVNCADDLFIHVGFCALKAMSRSGRSRPFHRDADGLVPAEGAAVLVLKRLPDAEVAGETILGVIRGIGLSNDGRGQGFLAPAEEGQVRAMTQAYEMSGLRPADISLVECHATGTAVGDATEIRSTGRVFEGLRDVPIGSLKSNLGHLITVAGAAGLIKVTGALHAGIRPPTLHADDPSPVLAGSPFRLLAVPEPWTCPGPRRAALSAFGFGGNNAHVIVEEHQGSRSVAGAIRVAAQIPAPEADIAIVAIGAVVADGTSAGDFARAFLSGQSRLGPSAEGRLAGSMEEIALPLTGLRFPPRDLQQALPQQLLVLQAAREAVAEAGPLPRDRTSILVGMQCDPEIARYGARWRIGTWAPSASADWLDHARDAFCPPLEAAGVVGSMPNIPANRLNSQFDLGGPSFTVSAEELSGIVALELAATALGRGEIDAAIVAAVDVSAEPVHVRAARDVLNEERQVPGDAAVALVVKRLADARRDGNHVYALLAPHPAGEGESDLTLELDGGAPASPDHPSIAALFGHAHAASGLLQVAAAAAACRHRALPGTEAAAPWLPAAAPRHASIVVHALGGASAALGLLEERGTPGVSLLFEPPPRLHVFSGADRGAVGEALRSGTESNAGPARLVIVSSDAQWSDRRELARRFLETGAAAGPWLQFRERPIEGELAFVFTGPAGAYAGMGRELLLALPELADALGSRFGSLREAAAWVYTKGPVAEPSPSEKLWGSSVLSQAHAELTRRIWKLRPQAAIGFCSGETNALFALEAWRDLDAMYHEIHDLGLYTRELAGEFAAVRRAWREPGEIRWTNWRILAPLDQVVSALEGEARVHLTILNAPGDCVIGGDAAACERVVARVGPGRSRPLGYDIAIHCPELGEFRDAWWKLHHRTTFPVPGVRFYSHATLGHYEPTAQRAADALLGLAARTVDFPRLVQRAWDDGVRVFLEHGPQGGCSRWISRILADREHLAVPLDVAGESALTQALHAAAQLIVAGVQVDHTALESRLHFEGIGGSRGEPATLRVKVHRAPPLLPPLGRGHEPGAGTQFMAPAPALPPITSEAAPRPPGRMSVDPAPAFAASEPPLAAPPLGGVLEGIAAHQRRLAETHRQFVAQQTQIHRRFLALRGGAVADAPTNEMLDVWPAPASLPPPRAAPQVDAALVRPPLHDERPGPRFSRAQLEVLASGAVSSVFGPLFERQDGYRRQVRMPEPPLLLADRVVGLAGEPGSMGKGTIWTETDVREDAWYLHVGRMPAGILIESGQADLLLISWLGVDFLNRGERVYRLLGCDLTYHGGLPRPGETLRYDIHVDGHARQGDVRLFFFHYDCRVDETPRLTVRNGQAGFFTEQELLESAGVLWDPATTEHRRGRVDPPAVAVVPSRFSAEQVRSFSEGRVVGCFGRGYERSETHVRTPRIAAGDMLLLGEVTHLDPAGGPWGCGYMRAVSPVSPDDWFFTGHFKNDPCMPGTLMFEACLEAMAFYLAALGFTLDRDGWRFEPVPDETYSLRCRGQVAPSSRELVYELFVEEVMSGEVPTLYADLLCTVDGLKAFHCRRMGLRLVPDWPLTTGADRLVDASEHVPVVDGFRCDPTSLLAAAWGPPSDAFGPRHAVYDGARRAPRLPGPPYHFMSRVTSVELPGGVVRPGIAAELEYDVPGDAWYLAANGGQPMPFCVLLEASLQPCGWLGSMAGIPLDSEEDLFFRNLDGTATWTQPVPAGAGALRTRVKLTDISRSAGMTLVSYDVECRLAAQPLYLMKTVFGYFPEAALAQQVGLPTTDEERAWLERGSGFMVDLATRPDRHFGGALRLPGEKLLMLDRVTGYWPDAGPAGLGRLRAEKDIRPNEWFFKAHFFQDPVQPGSLGLEAMRQLLQFYMIERGLASDIPRPRLEPLGPGRTFTWKYRGQVVPANRLVVVEAEILEAGRDERGAYAAARAFLWVDGKRIYSCDGFGMRIVPSTNADQA